MKEAITSIPTFNHPLKSPRKRLWMAGIAMTIVIAGYFFAARPVFSALKIVKKTQDDFRFLKDGFLLQNMDQIKGGAERLNADVVQMRKAIGPLIWTGVCPFFGSYYHSARHTLTAAEHLSEALLITVDTLYPLAPNLGFEVAGKKKLEVGGQDKIAALLTIFPVLATKIDSLKPELDAAAEDMAQVRPQYFPENLRGIPLRANLFKAQELTKALSESVEDLRTFLGGISKLMGYDSPKKYLFLFQNDKELRPTGGFWTAYAIFTVDKGKIVDMQTDDMYNLDLDRPLSFYFPAPPVVKNYLKIDYWYIRDANLSPDYPTAVEDLFKHWNRLGLPKVDGVVAVDTHFVESLLGVLGEVNVGGYKEPFTNKNVVYQLELYSNVWGKNVAGRKNIVGDLMREIINIVFGMPGNKYDDFLAMVISEAQRKHLLLNFTDEQWQKLATTYGFGGDLKSYGGDYLHINDANLAGRKANWWMKEQVVKEVVKEGDKWVSTVTINYHNDGEYNAEWNTGYLDYVRVYVPQASKLLSSEGSNKNVETLTDLGKTVFDAYMRVQPGEKQTLKIKYELPAEVVKGKEYKLLIQKQPGTEGYQYEVKVGGKTEKFVLEKDREVKLKL